MIRATAPRLTSPATGRPRLDSIHSARADPRRQAGADCLGAATQMANLFAIHSVGNSLVTFLRNSYPQELRQRFQCEMQLLSSEQLNNFDVDRHTLSLYLYRVTQNEHLRTANRLDGLSAQRVPLSLDLHYLLTVWSESAVAEQVILTWAMYELHRRPVLDPSSLSGDAAWGPGDVIHLIPAELNTEDVMRIWDALQPPYHLSVSYIARVVRVDPEQLVEARPVVATRQAWTDAAVDPDTIRLEALP